jgi:hypothetical protein
MPAFVGSLEIVPYWGAAVVGRSDCEELAMVVVDAFV